MHNPELAIDILHKSMERQKQFLRVFNPSAG